MSAIIFFFVFNTLSAQAVSCTNCSAINALTDSYSALKPDNASDRKDGYKKLTQVLKYVDAFSEARDVDFRTAELEALVALTAAALPFDPERSLSAQLDKIVSSHKRLKKTFDSAIDRIGSSCHKQLFKAQIESYSCAEKHQGGISYDKKGKAINCAGTFKFEDCIKTSKTK